MKKIYMKPEMEVHEMEVEQLICFSASSTPANSGKDILNKERFDFDDDIDQIINPSINPSGNLFGNPFGMFE